MISIRVRIFLLAIVTLSAVSLAFYAEYLDIKERLDNTKQTQHISQDLLSLSNLIHPLQKERGLTVNYLFKSTNHLGNQLIVQRNKTDTVLSKSTKLGHLHDDEIIKDFPLRLKRIRQEVDKEHVIWDQVNVSYSDLIQQISDLILVKVGSMDYSEDIAFEVQLLSYLTLVRESFGAIRDTVYQDFQIGKLSEKDLINVQSNFIQFEHNFRLYNLIATSHIEHEGDLSWLLKFEKKSFDFVLTHLNRMLDNATLSVDLSAESWWRETTNVIDSMKQVEDTIFADMQDHIKLHLSHYESYLFWYGVLALSVLIATLMLTAFIISRILKALSILIYSLNQVEKEQNFELRIYTQSGDEFGQLSLSINNLLSYTDNLIKEKDYFAKTDPLTGLQNRRSFIAEADRELQRSRRYKHNVSMIFCDIDFFKQVNDEYGHAIGDEALRLFSRVLQENLRESDCIGRWGGEEFIILAPEADLISAKQLAEKLRVMVMNASFAPVQQLTASFGVAQYQVEENFDALYVRTDEALYLAKNNGRNKVCIKCTDEQATKIQN